MGSDRQERTLEELLSELAYVGAMLDALERTIPDDDPVIISHPVMCEYPAGPCICDAGA